MDRDKLNKAAQEARITTADWLMQQPLFEKLTDAEKEKIHKWYDNAQKDICVVSEFLNP